MWRSRCTTIFRENGYIVFQHFQILGLLQIMIFFANIHKFSHVEQHVLLIIMRQSAVHYGIFYMKSKFKDTVMN